MVRKFRLGDEYVLRGRVGGGGGHRLVINKVEVIVKSHGGVNR